MTAPFPGRGSPPPLPQLVLASHNAGKLREFAALFAEVRIRVLPQAQFAVPPADEPHPSFLENALAKARHASRATGLPALADDSGLCVAALADAPGVQSARYAGAEASGPDADAANNAKLLAALAPVPAAQRQARYVAVLVLVRHAEDPQPLVAEGVWHGEILAAPRGTGGFGYDPLFWLPELGLSAAELPPETKNRVSHRGRALQQLLARLRTWG